MQPNPVLRKLGLSDNDRVAILHVDDIGSSHAANAAYFDLFDFGLISSGAVMVPCAWFPQAAAFCREHPAVDMGVHLTVNSEFDASRWRPLTTHDSASGLLDSEGFFHRLQPAVWEHGDPDAVYTELKAQIDAALAAGIDVTHLDTHMGTVTHPKFAQSYIRLALEYRLPPSHLLRGDETALMRVGATPDQIELAVQAARLLEDQGVPLLDNLVMMPLDAPENRLDTAKNIVAALPPGITYLLFHPCQDTPETRALYPDWPCRVGDYQAFMSEDLRAFIQSQGVHIIGSRVLRDLMRVS